MTLRLSEEELEKQCDFIRKLGEEEAKAEAELFLAKEEAKQALDLEYLNACQINGTQRQREAIANTNIEVINAKDKVGKAIEKHKRYKRRLDLEMAKLDIWRTISANTRKEKDWYNKGN